MKKYIMEMVKIEDLENYMNDNSKKGYKLIQIIPIAGSMKEPIVIMELMEITVIPQD